MKPPFLPRPAAEALASVPVHVLIRDYPEVLSVLREAGVDPAAAGALPLSEAAAGRPGILEAVASATAWRPPAVG